jgi:hypothetical protein
MSKGILHRTNCILVSSTAVVAAMRIEGYAPAEHLPSWINGQSGHNVSAMIEAAASRCATPRTRREMAMRLRRQLWDAILGSAGSRIQRQGWQDRELKQRVLCGPGGHVLKPPVCHSVRLAGPPCKTATSPTMADREGLFSRATPSAVISSLRVWCPISGVPPRISAT